MQAAMIIDPTRNVVVAMAFDRSLRQSLALPVIADSEHRCSRVVPPCKQRPLRLSGREITPSCLPYALPRHRSCVTVSGAYVCACGHKLSLAASQVPLPTRHLRLPFRAVDNGLPRSFLQSPRSHTDSHVPPTHRRSSRLHYKPSARQLPFSVCDA